MTATPALNVNQFAQIPVLGQMDLEFQGSVFTGAVSVNQATALVAGQPVYVENSAGGVPKVLALPGNSTPANGVVARNFKDQSFPANGRVEVAFDDSVIWLLSNAAINRWSAVEADTSTPGNVGPALGVNPRLGIAFDEATGSGQLIRVLLKLPVPAAAVTQQVLRQVVTLAQINAGLVLIPGVPGRKIQVEAVTQRVVGNFATGTSVELESTNASPVAVVTTAEAGLTDGAFLFSGDTHNTIGAGFFAPLGTGDGLKVVNNGSAQTGGTSITYGIIYSII
jgi:hypothetical protein